MALALGSSAGGMGSTAGSGGMAKKPRGAGSVGLVADLSNKLARQRKQLDELVSQNAAKKSTWKWYHVLGLILLNNIFVMVRGGPAPPAPPAPPRPRAQADALRR